eukprot:1382820-Amorphochlora_amoeboformis.AAC.1
MSWHMCCCKCVVAHVLCRGKGVVAHVCCVVAHVLCRGKCVMANVLWQAVQVCLIECSGGQHNTIVTTATQHISNTTHQQHNTSATQQLTSLQSLELLAASFTGTNLNMDNKQTNQAYNEFNFNQTINRSQNLLTRA